MSITYDPMLENHMIPVLNICKLNKINLNANSINRYNKRAAINVSTVVQHSYTKSQVIGFTIHKEYISTAKILHMGALPEHVHEVIKVVLGDLQSSFNMCKILIPETNLFMLQALKQYQLVAQLERRSEGIDQIKFTWERAGSAKIAHANI